MGYLLCPTCGAADTMNTIRLRGYCEITVALLRLLAVLLVLSSSPRLATLISQQPLRAEAAIETEAFVTVRGAATFPQQLPFTFVLTQHQFSVLIVGIVLQQQEVTTHVGT